MNNSSVYYIFDARPIGETTLLKLVTASGMVKTLPYKLRYYGYVKPTIDPDTLVENILRHEKILDAWVENWFKPPYYVSDTEVVVYTTHSYDVIRKINSWIMRKNIGYPVNTYPDPLIEALWRARAPVLTPVRIKNNGFVALENPSYPGYREPPLSHLYLRLYKYKYRFYDEQTGFDTVEVSDGSQIIYVGRDLGQAVAVIKDMKPVVLYCNMNEKIFIEERYPSLRRYYNIWIDDEGVPVAHEGLVYWARISYTPLHMLNYASIGRVLSTIEALNARKRKYLLVKGYGRVERWRSVRSLVETDRGGLVYNPRPGLYWNICQIDYNSLYPNIIARYNISGETVDNPYCEKIYYIKNAPHMICLDRRGLVSSVLKKLVEYREQAKDLASKNNDPIYDLRSKALKWILVSGFGYLGYRNSFFGSISAHETVTWFARKILSDAIARLESRNYRVVHVLVDSLFVKGRDCSEILEIVESTGLKAKIEAEYVWLYIPRSRTTGLGAANRYYGKLVNGELKIKGVSCVRRDTPLFIKETQLEAIKELGEASDPEEFAEKLRAVEEIYSRAEEMIRKGIVEPWRLGINVSIHRHESRRRNTDSYNRKILGFNGRGGTVTYIVAPGRAAILLTDNIHEYDKEYYVELLRNTFSELPKIDEVI